MTWRLDPEEARLWARVTATVRPSPGRGASSSPSRLDPRAGPMIITPARPVPTARRTGAAPPDPIEPGRKRRIVRGRDRLDAVLDLHGLDQARARAILSGFLRRAQSEGHRAVLVITGKGVMGDGILRRAAPEWLSDPVLRDIVAGFSPAAQHHGGDGALYVALKRPCV